MELLPDMWIVKIEERENGLTVSSLPKTSRLFWRLRFRPPASNPLSAELTGSYEG